MLTYLQNGPLKLGLVLVTSWLGLFSLFVTFSAFLRGHEFQHSVSVIPDGVVEQRVISVGSLKSYPLSPINEQVLSLLSSSYIPFTFDTTPHAGKSPRINGNPPTLTYAGRMNDVFSIPVSSKHSQPWNAFGVQPVDAVLLNQMVYDSNKGSWSFPSLMIYPWVNKSETTPDQEVIRLTLKHYYTPGDEFALLVRTQDSWSIQFSRDLQASAPSRALPFLRTIGIFLWPALFHNFLGAAGLAGVFLLWVCIVTTGYASVTILVTQWLISRETGEIRIRQGAAQRWEEEGWEVMGVVVGNRGVRRQDGEALKVDALH